MAVVGLEMVSAQTSRVDPVMAAATASRSVVSTATVAMPDGSRTAEARPMTPP